MDQTGSKRRSELSPSGICCQLPPLAALQTARIQVAACWRSKDSAQRHGLEDWDQSTDSLSGEERVARGLSVVLCQVVVWSSLYHSRRTRRGWSSGLQRLLIVIRVFFFSFPFLAFPTFLTTYTRDTFCLLPPFLTFASDPGHWVLSSTRFGRPSSQVHFGGVWLQFSLRSVRSVPFRADPGGCFPFLFGPTSEVSVCRITLTLFGFLLPASGVGFLRYLFSRS